MIKEKAVSVVLYKESIDKKCSWCFKNIEHVFYPCRQCTQVCYCHFDCERKSFENGFHGIECGLINLFNQNCAAWHTFRLVTLLGLQNIDHFYKDYIKSDNIIKEYINNKALQSFRFEELDSFNQMKIIEFIDLFVDHKDFQTKNDFATVAWAVKIVITNLIKQSKSLI